MNEIQHKQFTGWAIVDVLGHQRHIGHVTTEYYGNAAMFRIEVPALPEQSRTLADADNYIQPWGQFVPTGSVVREGAVDGDVVMVGAGSIYQLRPCSQETALLERAQQSPRKVVSVTAPDGTPIERDNETPW